MANNSSHSAGPQTGDQAPDFTLTSDAGDSVSLAALRGKRVILYFYPKDETPGCTTQACDFRDNWAAIAAAGAAVYGVSPDSAASHQQFRDHYQLPFALLVDDSHAVAEKYGVWQEKQNFGKRYFGIARTTFGIDENGLVAFRLERSAGDGHAQAALEWLRGLPGKTSA